ncbi:MAG: hypothetical protein H7235_06070 [Bdellovibrionaceae bacterium]|nr:hypothetical protein [Pseudobdellovibrionaceae bacterium]
MLPKISETFIEGDLTFWRTSDGKIGTGFSVVPCDLELDNPKEFTKKIAEIVKLMSPNLLGRIHFKSARSNENLLHVSRSRSLSHLGYQKNEITFYVTSLGSVLDLKNIRNLFSKHKDGDDSLNSIISLKNSMENAGLKITPLSNSAVLELCDINYELIKTTKSLESATESIGIIRLIKQASSEIDEFSLHGAVANLSDYEISVSFRRISEATAKILLEKRLKQLASAKDVSSRLKSSETENSISAQFTKGTQLVEFEFLVILKRPSQTELSKDISIALSEFNKFGDFQIETYGVAESFTASLPASTQHVTLLESNECLPLLTPIYQKSDKKSNEITRALTLHRENEGLTHFDLFNSQFNNFNALIIGTSGKGKSVLTGLLTKSLLSDPNINIIKVDVGGSHSKECELFGGTEFVMKLDEPSGINPFLILKTKVSESEKVGILSKFISVLILENGETQFSKAISSKIEECIQKYAESNPEAPDLNDFYNKSLDFPRRNLLKRWAIGGVYESAFSKKKVNEVQSTQLRYYNFSQVFQAADPEFASAGIAAVLAQFNIDSSQAHGKRLVLICDETPFFIKSCFDFFKFSTANVRKYGHATILTAQLSSQLIVSGDSGIIENSPQRFLFNVDGKPKEFQERFDLSDQHMEAIHKLRSIPGKFSEAFLQVARSGKKVVIRITPEEYWELTTSHTDKVRIEQVRSAFPKLKLQEILKCLSLA